MSTGVLIAILVVAAIVLLVAMRAARGKRLDSRRVEAGEHREEAELRDARAKQAEGEAKEKRVVAERERAAADEAAERAEKVDPDS